MDNQLKRGFLEIGVLAALKNKDLYGYKLIQTLKPYLEISESTLYPILKRLEGSECLTNYTVEHHSRLRKYYRITQKGREKIKSFLKSWQELLKIHNFVKGEDEIG